MFLDVIDSDEDTDLSARKLTSSQTPVLEGVVGGLQEYPLVGVHGLRLARIDAEELGIELFDLGDISAADEVETQRTIRIDPVLTDQICAMEGPDERLGIGTSAPGQIADRDPAGHQIGPVLLRIIGRRQMAGHAHYRDIALLGTTSQFAKQLLGLRNTQLMRSNLLVQVLPQTHSVSPT